MVRAALPQGAKEFAFSLYPDTLHVEANMSLSHLPGVCALLQ